jgi:hypothetical protein
VKIAAASVSVGARVVEVVGELLPRHAANMKMIKIKTGVLLRNMIGYLPNLDPNIQLPSYDPLFYIILRYVPYEFPKNIRNFSYKSNMWRYWRQGPPFTSTYQPLLRYVLRSYSRGI